MIAFSIRSCPRCDLFLEARFYLLSSGLGPASVSCPRCKAVYFSGRKEWLEMSGVERAVYIVVSMIYAGALGAIGAVIHWSMAQGARGMPPPFRFTKHLDAFGLMVGVTLFVQLARLAFSLRRTRTTPAATVVARWWSLDANLQLKMALALLGVPLLRASVEWLRS